MTTLLVNWLRLHRQRPQRGILRRVGLGLICVAAVLSIPVSAAADPLKMVLPAAALQDGQVVTDADVLSGIRGRGAEGPDVMSAGPDLAVVLWDELERPTRNGQSGSIYSHSAGNQNMQASTLSATRY